MGVTNTIPEPLDKLQMEIPSALLNGEPGASVDRNFDLSSKAPQHEVRTDRISAYSHISESFTSPDGAINTNQDSQSGPSVSPGKPETNCPEPPSEDIDDDEWEQRGRPDVKQAGTKPKPKPKPRPPPQMHSGGDRPV